LTCFVSFAQKALASATGSFILAKDRPSFGQAMGIMCGPDPQHLDSSL